MTGIRRSVASGAEAEADMGICDALSRVAGLSLDHYLIAHTFVPFSSFDRPVLQLGKHSCLSVLPGLLYSLNTLRGAAIACPACIQNDERNLGYSYWRRQHQLPGHHNCYLHPGTRLFAVARTGACMRPPGYWLRFVGTPQVVSLPGFEPTLELAGFHAASRAMLNSPVARCLWRTIAELVYRFQWIISRSRKVTSKLDAQIRSDTRGMRSGISDVTCRLHTSGILERYYPKPLLLELRSRAVWCGESLTGLDAGRQESSSSAAYVRTVSLVMGLCLTRWYGDKTWDQPSRWIEVLLAIKQLRISDAKFQGVDIETVRIPWAGASVATQAQLGAADFYRVIRDFRGPAKSQDLPRSTARLLRASEAIIQGADDRRRESGCAATEVKLLGFALRLLTTMGACWTKGTRELPSGVPLVTALDMANRAAARLQQREPLATLVEGPARGFPGMEPYASSA